jgi:hypothetical protein
MDSLKYHLGLPCPRLLNPAGGPPLSAFFFLMDTPASVNLSAASVDGATWYRERGLLVEGQRMSGIVAVGGQWGDSGRTEGGQRDDSGRTVEHGYYADNFTLDLDLGRKYSFARFSIC